MENELLMSSLLPTWHSLLLAPDLSSPPGAEQSLGFLFAPYWDKSTESSGCRMLDSAISSMDDSAVSPPNTSNDGFLMRGLIGKLGGSCEFPPQTYNSGHLYKESAPMWGHPTSAANPGFPELSPAARFSSLGTRSFNGRTGQYLELAATGKTMSRISSSPSLRPTGSPWGAPRGNTNPNPASQDRAELSNSQEESSVSNPGKIPGPELAAKTPSEANWRKRRAVKRGKEAEIEDGSGTKRDKKSDGCNENANGSVKIEDEEKGGGGDNADVKDEKLLAKNETKPPEPSKDYIHVRARRGQATDSHSLAERVRREKISERMKILQDLVPGCSKVTGKALMLDEIINYVQSLQRQVEFLSMKLATVNAGMDGSMNTTMMKDAFKPESNDPLQMLPSSAALYVQKIPAASISDGAIPQYSVDPFLPYQAFHGGDLHSIIQMSCGQD